MNWFLIGIIIFVIVYLFLNWFAKTSTKKIAQFLKRLAIVISIFLAAILAIGGKYIFSLPFVLAILPLIKTKAGISLFQLLRLWGLFRVLRNSGRFNFNKFNQSANNQNISLDEAYKILNLKSNKKGELPTHIIRFWETQFKQIKPKTLGQALRIDGITPAAVYILLSHVKRKSIKHIA